MTDRLGSVAMNTGWRPDYVTLVLAPHHSFTAPCLSHWQYITSLVFQELLKVRFNPTHRCTLVFYCYDRMEIAGLGLAVIGIVPPLLSGLQQLRQLIEEHRDLSTEWQKHSVALNQFEAELRYLQSSSI
jgi:hypothetical protein